MKPNPPTAIKFYILAHNLTYFMHFLLRDALLHNLLLIIAPVGHALQKKTCKSCNEKNDDSTMGRTH